MIILKNSGIIEKRNPIINIITRTSNRPNFFEKNRESVISQSYQNINHIVGYDDKNAEEYLNQYEGIQKHYIPKDYVSKIIDIPDPKTGTRFEYNLYFNLLFSKVKEGWILILDDDDCLINDKVISHMVMHLKYKTDMLIFQMQYKNGNVLPAKQDLYKKPVIGKIGSPCILVHSSIAKKIKWDGWKCADYRYISKCWDLTERKVWLNVPLISIGSTIGNFGSRNDIKNTNTPTYPSVISRKEIVKKMITPFLNPSEKEYRDIILTIPTFERYEYLDSLLEQLERIRENIKYEVFVVDDNSRNIAKVKEIENKYKNFHFDKNSINYGKTEYWKTFNKMLQFSSNYRFRHLVEIDDDFKLCDNFVEELNNLSTQYPKKFIKYIRDSSSDEKADGVIENGWMVGR